MLLRRDSRWVCEVYETVLRIKLFDVKSQFFEVSVHVVDRVRALWKPKRVINNFISNCLYVGTIYSVDKQRLG